MDAFSSPFRLMPSLTPRRAPSPTMSPGGRRGRAYGGSEESRLRDLSPDTTLRAFTQKPMPFDTSQDEYKILSCIDALTAAERDLGMRVAKAAQRLKSWCTEIEQWGWSGSFEQPSVDVREQRRRSLELRIREHVPSADVTKSLRPLEYWGSLLSNEVEQHDCRLDDIEEEMLKLDVEELKEHVLDMHPAGKSRRTSASFEAAQQNYKIMDDFSFLITQTLLSALPHHAQLKDRLLTWTARVSILREAPKYLSELEMAQKAMRLGWDAIEQPADTSDLAFAQWKEAVDTISGVLQDKVSDLGRRLDTMLDTLEGREDCLPENWIDIFEGIEADYGRWVHESRRRVIDLEVRRKEDKSPDVRGEHVTGQLEPHSEDYATPRQQQPSITSIISDPVANIKGVDTKIEPTRAAVTDGLTGTDYVPGPKESDFIVATPRSDAASKTDVLDVSSSLSGSGDDVSSNETTPEHGVKDNIKYPQHKLVGPRNAELLSALSSAPVEASAIPFDPPALKDPEQGAKSVDTSKDILDIPSYEHVITTQTKPLPAATPTMEAPARFVEGTRPVEGVFVQNSETVEEDSAFDVESEFDEGDTIVHHELDGSPEEIVSVQPASEKILDDDDMTENGSTGITQAGPRPLAPAEYSVVITSDEPTDEQDSASLEPPQTPRSRRGSVGSLSSEMSFGSSSPGFIDDSPSVRNATNRALRAPRPELNAAMSKRRPAKATVDEGAVNPPWPPTRFAQKPTNSAEDLERKISDILTTIPAHIRLTSGPGADAPEVKSARSLTTKSSRGYLRATHSVNGMKSPELTLSPAKSEYDSPNAVSGRRSATALRGDNDIKLYHLTQPGKEHPIKLFIRRVGENGERVMVRVGGGWADLGEYLRQYAEHHGRRTVSDGKFEILGLEVKNSGDSPARPDSSMSKKDRRFSGGHHTGSPSTTPVKSAGVGISKEEVSPMPSFTSTPVIAEEVSLPSTNSSQRSWQGNEVGLAGPKSKKLELSGEKLDWIEGMMKQARTVSSNVMTTNHLPLQREDRVESRSESRSDSRTGSRAGGKKPDFGDLGKIGGTKRIFMRGGRPSLSEQ
ncbi:uncharacterized protein K460DRAFT_362908 [Cucurbitaria berberidis CBS 394.84]|uniref:GAR domain-containing protein n=1 Tax=Cucurbitaria berberidis CBS 394.84 TaxID=1168544 RepID=A0A9P4LEP1_9PLEO|nr:uncharacterized protein K460DRAFT_362908 [Cucurbitaria berberidis CBS 394.84]KAF1852143.1 hypothetical protein K460DRAFT_362908 [Cucurbitaria berberidis CBS 394.84]